VAPPRVNLNVKLAGKNSRAVKKEGSYYRKNTGHAFSANNPLGKKENGDVRQFSY